ncbi:MAG: OmpA family protein [Sphingobacteriia bacterium]|nr:OmpA family protein [Sphingobacteriia bacterium]
MAAKGQGYWIPLADLMTGLMMLFMLIAVSYMGMVEQTTTLIVKEYEKTREDLKRALQEEFADKLKEWDAEILGDMTLKFKNPEVLFDTGKATLKPKFKEILNEFIPRYISILTNERFKDYIKEIRIEGHTSPRWENATLEQAYFKNMKLSQERTTSALEYVLQHNSVKQDIQWLRRLITANGLSSSRPVFKDEHGRIIDELASQRVEFKIITNSDEKISQIAKSISQSKNDKF